MPLRTEGESKRKAFLGGVLSGVVEELIPEMSQGQHSNIGTLFFALGFSLMMILDVALTPWLIQPTTFAKISGNKSERTKQFYTYMKRMKKCGCKAKKVQ